MRAVDDERDDPADGRIEQSVAEPGDSREDDERGQAEMAGRVEPGERPDGDEAPDVRQDHHPAAFVTIGERATDQQRRQQACALNRENEADLAGARDRERLPAERGQEGRIPDQRDRLAGEQKPKIAVPQRLKRPRAACLQRRVSRPVARQDAGLYDRAGKARTASMAAP